MSAEGSGPVYVGCVQISGVNKSKANIQQISGYVVSNITGEKLPLTMEGMRPEETNGIPAKCQYFIQALFRDPASKREGFTEERFMRDWGDFTFFFKADKKEYSYRFRRGEISRRIQDFSKALKQPPAPLITRREAK